MKAFPLEQNDVVFMRAAAGGGVGDPLEREVELVMKDVIAGYVSVRRAADVYGVAIEDGHVDQAKTDALRGQKKQERHYFKVTEAATDEFDDRGLRLCPMGREVAERIGAKDGDTVEYIGKQAAPPLRAWAKIVEGADADELPVGPTGRKILGVSSEYEVWLRTMKVNRADDPIDKVF